MTFSASRNTCLSLAAFFVLSACSESGDAGSVSSTDSIAVAAPLPSTPEPDVGPSDPGLPPVNSDSVPLGQSQDDGSSSPLVLTLEEAADLIVGEWLSLDVAIECRETFTTNDDGTFVYTSLMDRSTGTFEIRTVDGDDRQDVFLLILDVQADDVLADCDGVSEENLESIVTDMEFPDVNTMHWIAPDEPAVIFERIVAIQ